MAANLWQLREARDPRSLGFLFQKTTSFCLSTLLTPTSSKPVALENAAYRDQVEQLFRIFSYSATRGCSLLGKKPGRKHVPSRNDNAIGKGQAIPCLYMPFLHTLTWTSSIARGELSRSQRFQKTDRQVELAPRDCYLIQEVLCNISRFVSSFRGKISRLYRNAIKFDPNEIRVYTDHVLLTVDFQSWYTWDLA